jgi:rubrerythrin
MPEKPSYLGLLNAIAVAESRAHTYLTAWIKVTPDPDVRSVLATVAAREGEHGMSFAKRINELGFEVRAKEDPGEAERLAVASSDIPDLEKLARLGLDRIEADVLNVFDDVFKDHTIDIRTGELLGRYIAEERDTLRLLQGCQRQLQARPMTEDSSSDRLGALEEKIDAVCRGVEELRQIVCAQAMPTDRI